MELDVDKYVNIVENDSFAAIRRAGRGQADARMARDLLDYLIEHLSKWWKMTETNEALHYGSNKLWNYSNRTMSLTLQDDLMKDTIAVVPHGIKDSSNNEVKEIWKEACCR